jgi:hypothetical protein
MRKMRLGVPLLGGVLGALLCASVLGAQELQGVETYPATLQFGTGVINIPVAWISPRSGDVWVTGSGKSIPTGDALSQFSGVESWNTNVAIETHWFGRFSVGASLYSQNPEWGFFGQALLIGERDLRDTPGLARWMPSLAVGVRNVGPYDHEDRFLIGHDRQVGAGGAFTEGATPFAQRFKSTPTLYGVATKSFALGAAHSSLTVGYGNGLFRDDGDLGALYNDKGQITPGLFFGATLAFHPSATTTITVLGENDGWDWNAGLVGAWRGMYVGVYGTELEEGTKSPSKGALYRIYNYAKLNLAVGLNTNLFATARASTLRGHVGELERERQRLRGELLLRERRISALEGTLQDAEGGRIADVAARRAELEARIRAERDAISRAEARLRKIREGQHQTASSMDDTTPPSH